MPTHKLAQRMAPIVHTVAREPFRDCVKYQATRPIGQVPWPQSDRQCELAMRQMRDEPRSHPAMKLYHPPCGAAPLKPWDHRSVEHKNLSVVPHASSIVGSIRSE